jgi:hypothetical protein
MDKVSDLSTLLNADNLYSLDEESSSESENDDTEAGRSGLVYTQKKAHRLQNEVCTRWNSSLEMIEGVLHMRAEITSALKSIGKYDQCLRVQDWALLEELAAFLKTFRGLTELVSTKTTSLSLIPLLRAEVMDACSTNSTDDDDLKAIKSMINRNLDKRLPLTHSVKMATLLDPSTRALLQLSDDVMEDLLYAAATAASTTSQPPVVDCSDVGSSVAAFTTSSSSCNIDVSATPLSKKMKLIQKHTVSSQCHPDVRLRDQIKAYIRCEPDREDDDPLSFWRSSSSKFPLLQELARDTLTQSASSVPVENMFSTMGLLLNGKRSALAPHRANWLSFIHDNFALYFKTQ